MESLDSGHPTVKQKTASRVSVKARTLAHESYCGVLGWLHDVAHAAETETELKRKFPAVADVAKFVTNLLLGALLLPVHLHLGICDVLISAGQSNRLTSESDQHALLKLIYSCEVPCSAPRHRQKPCNELDRWFRGLGNPGCAS